MEAQSYDLNWIVSVDDHIVEPPRLWVDRVPARYREVAPRIVTDDHGREFWVYEDTRRETGGLGAVAGRNKEDFTAEGYPYREMRPGCYDAKARLEDMNQAGILASLNFPIIPRFCGQLFHEAKDKELALLCVKAYNDFVVDEWCATDPGRYIPLMLIPLWDPGLAVAEIHRMAAKGVTSVAFSENPEPLGLPTIHHPSRYWDPVLAAAEETGMVLSIHIGSSSTMHKISSDAPFMANMAMGAVRPAGCMLAWIFGGLFQRFPGIRIALSEGSIGWIPWFLERAQQVLDTQRHWVARGVGFGGMKEGRHATGGEVDVAAIDIYRDYREHFYGCIIDDQTGLAMLDVIGEDNVMVECDYPHSDSTWPDSITLMQERLAAANLSDEVKYKLLRGNAERLYRFTPSEPPELSRP